MRVWDISGLRKKGAAPGSDDSMRIPQVRCLPVLSASRAGVVAAGTAGLAGGLLVLVML